ncbi:hypothetical protein LJR168_003860 [Pseudoxanthomonas sp. LjRoot168]|uniref:hypothetical protein n=1 Tax=unclassified Pseudoxanthomonas TaxID=2645906 RepID=UPI003ECC421C
MRNTSLLTAALLAWGISPAPTHAVEHASELTAANAFQVRVPTPRGPSGPIDSWVVETMLSQPGQTKAEFIHDVSRFLDGWTMRTNVEACAQISVSPQGDQFGVRILTQKSQVNCMTGKDMVPFDFISTGESIHSHPNVEGGRVVLNEYSAKLLSLLTGERYRKGASLTIPSPENFSSTDYEGGRGFLVAEGRLKHQHGVGTEEDLGEIRASFAGP